MFFDGNQRNLKVSLKSFSCEEFLAFERCGQVLSHREVLGVEASEQPGLRTIKRVQRGRKVAAISIKLHFGPYSKTFKKTVLARAKTEAWSCTYESFD